MIAGWSNAFVLRLCLWAGVGLLLYFLWCVVLFAGMYFHCFFEWPGASVYATLTQPIVALEGLGLWLVACAFEARAEADAYGRVLWRNRWSLYFLLSFYASGLYALIYGVLFCGGMALHVRWHDFGTWPDRTLVGAYKIVLGFYGVLALYIVMLIVGGI